MLQVWAAVALVAIAIWFDCRERRIPNRLVAVGIAAGLVLGLASHGLRGVAMSFVGLLCGGAILFVPFALGGIGAGDVKLLAAVGAILGARGAVFSMLYGAVAGGVISAAVIARRRGLGFTARTLAVGALGFAAYAAPGLLGRASRLVRESGFARPRMSSGLSIPYSVAIGIGVVVGALTRFSIASIA